MKLNELTICIKGAGEMASGIAHRLYRSNFTNILMLEVDKPLAVRRLVSFCEAVYDNETTVEDVTSKSIENIDELSSCWNQNKIAVHVDPEWKAIEQKKFHVIIDAILAKRNLGTRKTDADLVIGLGPGFSAPDEVHIAIETQRGHHLGRALHSGQPENNTGIPGEIAGYSSERVLRAPNNGLFEPMFNITDVVEAGEVVAKVNGTDVVAQIGGVVRGLIRPGLQVKKGTKLGDIDPRKEISNCYTISEKARALGGAILEAILSYYNR